MRRPLALLSASILVLLGGVVAGSSVGGSTAPPDTVVTTDAAVVTTEVPAATEAPVAATDAPAATEAPAVVTEAPVSTAEVVVASTDVAETSTDDAASLDGHPLVGAWIITVDDDPDAPPTLSAFSSDGIYHDSEIEGLDGYGAWEATGPTSAALTLVQQFPGEAGESDEEGESEEGESDEEGEPAVRVTIRATIEVDPDGQSFTGEFTIEAVGEGAPAGEYGPGAVTGTRIMVEPMGTPAGSLDDLFGQFEEGTEPVSEDTAIVEDTMIVATETTEATPPTTS